MHRFGEPWSSAWWVWRSDPLREARETRTSGLRMGELMAVGKERFLLTVSVLAALYQINMWVTVYGFTPNVAAQLGVPRQNSAGSPS